MNKDHKMDGDKTEQEVSAPTKNSFSLANMWLGLGVVVGVWSLVFFQPLRLWLQLAMDSDTFSYVILIAPVTIYLIRLKLKSRDEADAARLRECMRSKRPSYAGAVVFAALAGVALAGYAWAMKQGWEPTMESKLAVLMTSYYLGVLAVCFGFLGTRWMSLFCFPICFLALIIPFPTPMTHAIEVFFQHTSAEVSHWFLMWSGTPVFRDGLTFKIPGITMRVAEECSGIRSSLVLFICSLVAGHMFLQTTWRRVFLVGFVIPLAIARNAFRILTIGLLCVHYGPHMINSIVHRRGGPVFFALSLIPFFLVLWWLYRGERARRSEVRGPRSEV